MAMNKVYYDQHSIYIKCDGQVFRPVQSKYDVGELPQEESHVIPLGFVKAHHVSQTNRAIVRLGPIREIWFGHGRYSKENPAPWNVE